MANLEDENRDFKETNSELAQEVQFLKVSLAQAKQEKAELMIEINELRLKLSRLRSGGAAQARKLDAQLQSASEEALSHLVQASGAIARTIELTKQYMQEQKELENTSPRWSAVLTPSRDKVNKVPPLLLGGQSLQPVVALSRTMLNSSSRSLPRTPNQNSSMSERAVPIPMHMLQDLYIPLERIDMADIQGNADSEEQEEDIDNSTDELGLEESNEQSTAEQSLRRLEAVEEEPEENIDNSLRLESENPLEGPSWLLDLPDCQPRGRVNLEPDSTTPCVELMQGSPSPPEPPHGDGQDVSGRLSVEQTPVRVFTPTVRRRKRTSTPPPSGSSSPSLNGSDRVLKVVLAKMRLSESVPEPPEGGSPPKRVAVTSLDVDPAAAAPFDAPSPNGATDAGMRVSESDQESSGEPSYITVRSWSRREKKRSVRHRSPVVREHSVTARERSTAVREHSLTARERSSAIRESLSVAREQSVNVREHSLVAREPSVSVLERTAVAATVRESSSVVREQSVNVRERSAAIQEHSRSPSPHRSRSRASCGDSDSSGDSVTDGRTRRPRKQVSYKEKPLNRKLRR